MNFNCAINLARIIVISASPIYPAFVGASATRRLLTSFGLAVPCYSGYTNSIIDRGTLTKHKNHITLSSVIFTGSVRSGKSYLIYLDPEVVKHIETL